MLMAGQMAKQIFLATLMVASLNTISAQFCGFSGPTDILIGLGDSLSTMTEWGQDIVYSPGSIAFVQGLLSQLDFSVVRVSLFAFSDSVRQISGFSSNPAYLSTVVENRWIPQFGGLRTFSAIRSFSDYLDDEGIPNAAKIMILITNRQSDNLYWTVSEAHDARDNDINIITVGSGDNNIQESLMISGSFAQTLGTDNDHVLVTLIPRVLNQICTMSASVPFVGFNSPLRKVATQRRQVDIILVADHSHSVRIIEGIQAKYCSDCLLFIEKLISSLRFPLCSMGITLFTDDVYVLSAISGNSKLLKTKVKSVDGLEIPYAGSSLEGGIAAAHAQFGNSSRFRSEKILVVLCDGSGENDALVRSSSVSVRSDGIKTYVVTWPSPGGAAINDVQLSDIAGDSSRIIKVNSMKRLPAVAHEIANMILPPA